MSGALGIKVDGDIVLESSSRISLKVGGSFVVIHSGGVDIVGPKISLNSGGSPGTPVPALQPTVLKTLGDEKSGDGSDSGEENEDSGVSDKNTDSYHGMWAHWMNGKTGKTIPFSRKDDGADIVESAFMFEGLLAAHQYFTKDNPTENRIRGIINNLWRQAEWNFFTQGQDVMYWHWSPNNGWAMNHQIKGHNECHIVYILGASSPTYPIAESVYHKGWANANTFLNGREYYGIKLPLGNNHGKGGPLFFTHYSYMGLDPRGLKDRYADYEEQMKAHTLINRAYCIDNPKGYKGYGEKCWGLTASDGDKGYSAHSPGNDRGVITPTAALSSIPYAPEYSLEAMRYFYEELGDRLWGEYGFKDAFNLTENWFAPSYLAIDQGPIIVMIENYRTGLIWKLFMSHPDVQKGLRRLGFTSPYLNKVD